MAIASRLSVVVPADPRVLPAVRAALRQWLAVAGLEAQPRDDVVLATWEACANAVEHPVAPAGCDLSVEAVAGPRGVMVVVRDTGTWRGPVARLERGRGLHLMTALMDDVAVARTARGTEVRMCRRA
jgi:anti-sigma regulatory factor (Ser/Thr protein kinase)